MRVCSIMQMKESAQEKKAERAEEKEMEYPIEELKKLALEYGFTHVGELNIKALVFMPEVREMCRADRCHAFGKNWRCPPACGSIEEASARAAQYSFGMILQTVGQMEDDFDLETIQSTGKKHAESFIAIMRELKKKYPDILGMGAGTCQRCKTCTYPDAPCRFPEDSYSSMEAYGLWVSKVCELSGIPYNYGPHTLAYTSCFLLK